jgi:hypothetical protein
MMCAVHALHKTTHLVSQMLKKAQRDCGQTVRNTSSTLTQALEIELDTAFRNFQKAVLRKETNMCMVREEYLTMPPHELLRLIFTKLRQLYQMVSNLQISWNPGHQTVGMTSAEKKKAMRTLDMLNNFAAQLGSDTLLQKLFQVI